MGVLNDIILEFWKVIFKILKPLTDNVAFAIIAASALFLMLVIIIRFVYVGFYHSLCLTDILFIYGVNYMVSMLPKIHVRLHTALSTVSGIILSSNEYMSSFKETTGLIPKSNAQISKYLYYTKDYSGLLKTEPEELYKHLFETLKHIRKIPIIGDVQGSSASMLVLSVIVCLIICLIVSIGRNGTYYYAAYVVKALALLLANHWLTNGAVLSMCFLWLTEEIICAIMLQINTQEVVTVKYRK